MGESAPSADVAVVQDFQQNAFTQLAPDLQRAILDQGYETPTPIQQQIIPALQEGRDAIGIAQTGTGKTAAFTLPLLHQLVGAQRPDPRRPRALILAPTRELAQQISDSIRTYGRYMRASHMVVYGGVSQYPQVKALRRGVDIVVATPGRLLDLARQGHIHLNSTGIFILDEVDRMLDMGFIEDINQIVDSMSDDRQTMFFSATMPPKIEDLARTLVTDPIRVEITPDQLDLDRITQKVRFVHRKDKMPLLLDMLHDRGDGEPMQKVIIFSQTKVMANKLAEQLNDKGFRTTAIHGDKTQRARAQALQGFKTNRFRVLVATDVAARGLDVDDISHVINYDLPIEAETYVHRIGRTGRAGRTGDAISFCSPGDHWNLRAVDKLMGEPVTRDFDHPYHNEKAYLSVERRGSGREQGRPDRPHRKARKPGQSRDGYRSRPDRKDWKKDRESSASNSSIRGKEGRQDNRLDRRNADAFKPWEGRKKARAENSWDKSDRKDSRKKEGRTTWPKNHGQVRSGERKSESLRPEKSKSSKRDWSKFEEAESRSDRESFKRKQKKDRKKSVYSDRNQSQGRRSGEGRYAEESSNRRERRSVERISRKTRRLKESKSQIRQGRPVASPALNTVSKKKHKDAKKKKERKLKREKTVLVPSAKSKKGKNTRRAEKRRKPWDNMHK